MKGILKLAYALQVADTVGVRLDSVAVYDTDAAGFPAEGFARTLVTIGIVWGLSSHGFDGHGDIQTSCCWS